MKYYLDFEEPLRIYDEEIHLKETMMDPSVEITKEVAILVEKRLKKIDFEILSFHKIQILFNDFKTIFIKLHIYDYKIMYS